MEEKKITSLFGKTKLMVIQNQILKVAKNVSDERMKQFRAGNIEIRPSVTRVLNEAMKIGLQQMTGMEYPIPEWKPDVFGATNTLPPTMPAPKKEKPADATDSDDL